MNRNELRIYESLQQPFVTFVIPVFNAADTLRRCVKSALRQNGVSSQIIVVDHGSRDNSLAIANELSIESPRVKVIRLVRSTRDRRTPARPLTTGLRAALMNPGPADRSWIFRLDADDVLVSDDVVAAQLAVGGYRALIMATLVFFDERKKSAYEYGPWPPHRSLSMLCRRGAYSVAHHATAMRRDLLTRVSAKVDPLLDETVDYGEDLSLTCRLLRSTADEDFAFVDSPYCFKSLGFDTATESVSLRRAWSSHMRLLRCNPELATYEVLRGFAELALARVIGESASRRSLQHLAGHNGFYRRIEFHIVAQRIRELELLL